jgi:hypothetical protein
VGSVGPGHRGGRRAERGPGASRPTIGLSGLQRSYDEQLGGTPGLEVEVVDGAGEVVRSLAHPTGGGQGAAADARPGCADRRRHRPRGRARGQGRRAGRGAAQHRATSSPSRTPARRPGVDRALTGRYPPGSTFKTASALALLRAGLQVDEVVPCPATLSVEGKAFKNAEDEVLGDQPFSVDFAPLVQHRLRRQRRPDQLGAARGGGPRPRAHVVRPRAGAFGADVPVTDDAVEHAAQVIGQGRVLASPLAVAVGAATVEAGRLRLPRLLARGPASAPGPELAEAADLQALTRSVVAEGTGTALRDVPGDPVRGKTGTAEYGTQVPPRTHAWFAGSSGDLAFAVLVEDGGFGGSTAAPVAAELLRAPAVSDCRSRGRLQDDPRRDRMAHYRSAGSVPRKRHTQLRRPDGQLYREELMGEEGFSSDSSLLYHLGVPSAVVDARTWELPDQRTTPNAPLLPRHLRLHDLFPGRSGRPSTP